MKNFLVSLFILVLVANSVYSQTQVLPLGRYYSLALLEAATASDSFVHTSFKPYITGNLSGIDSMVVTGFFPDSVNRNRSWVIRKLKTENFIFLKKKDIILRIDPLIHFETGTESMTPDYKLFTNTRGIIVRGDLGKNFSFESRFYENQGFYPEYLRSYIKRRYVVPGQGRIRNFKTYGFDFSSSSGFVSYSPWKFLNVQFGHGKNFVGDGYRSLLLSDNTYNYPFAKITTTHRRWQYTALWTAFINVFRQDNRDLVYQTKYGSFSMLNYLPAKWLQVGLFEGFIWHTSDSTYNNRFNANYFLPVPGYREAVYGLNDLNNAVVGLNMSSRIGKKVKFYGQYVVDDFKEQPFTFNKDGYQLGLYIFSPFGLKGLKLQAEYNKVKPFTYSFQTNTNQNYSHFSQPLAHPMGANFNETILMVDYSVKDFFIHLRYSMAVEGIDSLGVNFGQNIFTKNPVTVNSNFPAGIQDNITYKTIELGYLFNRTTNFQLFLGMEWRNEDNEIFPHYDALHVYGGIKTSLSNYYYDF
ncbi:MAG: hypothetical protein DRP35_10105 [Candidatus Zixiibacteriota bacterium]|nr:MAG: hypothetical protein DRP35_10105 [candidate division Zixibacteria bacterium]